MSRELKTSCESQALGSRENNTEKDHFLTFAGGLIIPRL